MDATHGRAGHGLSGRPGGASEEEAPPGLLQRDAAYSTHMLVMSEDVENGKNTNPFTRVPT